VRNTCLAGRSDLYRPKGASVTGVDLSREFTRLKRFPGYEGLGEASSTILTQKLRDQDCAFGNFFEGRAKYPRFKKKHHAQVIRYQFDKRVVAGMFRPEELLKVPKLGELDVRWSPRQGGIPKLVTVRKDAAKGYFVGFMVAEQVHALPEKPNGIGVDIGLKDLVGTSDGERIGNPKALCRGQRCLKHVQRILSGRKKGSGNWHRHRRKVARARPGSGPARRPSAQGQCPTGPGRRADCHRGPERRWYDEEPPTGEGHRGRELRGAAPADPVYGRLVRARGCGHRPLGALLEGVLGLPVCAARPAPVDTVLDLPDF
jgi:hypothetical protein